MTGRKRQRFPAIPRLIQGLAGPITVTRPAKITAPDGSERVGEWDAEQRVIRVVVSLPRRYAWVTFLHEVAHAAETDSGHYLNETKAASPHDAIAAGMLHVVEHLVVVKDGA